MDNSRLQVVHIACSDAYGGASRAGHRIYTALRNELSASFDFKMLVCERLTDDSGVVKFVQRGQLRRRILTLCGELGCYYKAKIFKAIGLRARLFASSNPIHHSECVEQTDILSHQIAEKSTIIHLHWIGRLLKNETVSIEEISRVTKPLIWTLHDQWAFCGAEHYTNLLLPGGTASFDERYACGYSPASRPANESGPDLNRLTWLRKQRLWRRPGRKPFQIVCPSLWLADCARRSALMGDWPITVIPYPIDLEVWAPCDQTQARALLDLPADRPLVFVWCHGRHG